MEREPIPSAIKNLFLFQGVNKESMTRINEILIKAETLHVSAGGIILDAANGADRLFVVLNGTASVQSDNTDTSVILRKVREGELFGAVNLYSRERNYRTTVRAETDCVLWSLPGEAARELIRSDSCIAENFIRFLTDRICFLNQKISAFTAVCAEEKLHVYLSGLPVNENGCVQLKGNISSLAASLNISRASLYRALDSLVSSGTILREGRQIRILHPIQ